jgi:hypothetical protein
MPKKAAKKTLPPCPRRKEYGELVAKLTSEMNGSRKVCSQGDLAVTLDVRRECISKRIHGQNPVTQEALLALRYVASNPHVLPGAKDVGNKKDRLTKPAARSEADELLDGIL